MFRDGEAIGRIAPSKLKRTALRAKLESLYTRVIALEYGTPRPG